MVEFKDYKEVAKKYNIGGGGFWNPQPGENKIRILTVGEAIGNHFIKDEKKSYICIGKEDGCKFCNADLKPSVKFLFWVLDREDGDVKIGQVGYKIFQALGELATDKDWGFDRIPDYDVTIKRTGEKLETEYFVTPTPNRDPLTAEEQKKMDDTVKDLKEVISKMKEKVGGSPDVINVEDDEDTNVDDIDFGDGEPK